MINEQIASLYGKLSFLVDVAGLRRFQSMLKATENQMKALDRQASALQAKLSRAFGVTGKGASSAKLKADALVTKSLDKELQLETKIARLQRQQYQTALASQKLTFTGERNAGLLQGDKLKAQTQSAVLAAKQHKAAQESLKVDLGRAKLQGTVEQSKIREAKLADILQRRQAQTVRLQQEAARHASTLQRAEAGLNNARAAGIRAAEKHLQSKQAHAAREARAAIRTEQATQRFSMQQDRHLAWRARQDAPTGGMGLGGLAIGVSGVGAAIFALTSAVGALGQRIEQRQAGASDAQTYENIFAQIGGKNPENGKRARSAFAEMTEKYGQLNNTETAGDFRVFMLSQQAKGIAMSKALETYATQQAAFRASGMTQPQQQRAVIQLQQVRSIGKADTEDVKTFAEAAPLIKQSIVEAWGARTKYKGTNLDGAFMKSIPDGKVLAQDFEAGLARFVSQQQDALARQMVSIDAQQNRVTNDKYLQAQAINTDAELVSVIGERLQAERELTEAMKPLKETLAGFDLGLTKVATYMLRLASNRNADGSEKSEEQQLQDRMSTNDLAVDTKMVGGHDYSNVDAATHRQGGWLGNFYNRLFNVPDYTKDGEANKMKALRMDALGATNKTIDMSKFGVDPENLADGQYRQFRLPEMFDPSESFRRVERLSQPYFPGAAPGQSQQPQVPNVTNTNSNNTTTIQPAQVKVDIHVTGMTAEEVEKISSREAQEVLERSWREAAANQKELK